MRERISRILYFLLSLLLAIAFWLYVDNANGNTITVTFDNLPIEFIGAEDTLPSRGLMLVDGQNATMNVTIKGPRMMINDLKASDIRVQVNLNNITSTGTWPQPFEVITPDTVSDSSISVTTSRSSVTVQVGTLYSRAVPIMVSVIGEVPDGYIYMSDLLVAEPSSLTLRGRAEDVDKVASARVVLDLTDATRSIQRQFDYELLDAEGKVLENDGGIRVSDRQVELTAPIYIIKELPLAVRIKESPGSRESYTTACSLDIDTVTVAGETANLETVERILLGEVDLSLLLSDAEIPFDIPIPAGCINVSGISSTTLTVQFRRSLEIRTFSVTNISAVGTSTGQHFDPLTSSVDVQIRGPVGSMDDLTEENIRIVVDLTEYVSNGTYSVPARVFVDGNDQVGAVGTYTVAGKITS